MQVNVSVSIVQHSSGVQEPDKQLAVWLLSNPGFWLQSKSKHVIPSGVLDTVQQSVTVHGLLSHRDEGSFWLFWPSQLKPEQVKSCGSDTQQTSAVQVSSQISAWLSLDWSLHVKSTQVSGGILLVICILVSSSLTIVSTETSSWSPSSLTIVRIIIVGCVSTQQVVWSDPVINAEFGINELPELQSTEIHIWTQHMSELQLLLGQSIKSESLFDIVLVGQS